MKKFVALLTLVLAVGFANAQAIEPTESVKQLVDARISKYEGKIQATDAQKEELRQIMYRYETLIEDEKKSIKDDHSNQQDIKLNVQKYRAEMEEELQSKLSTEQIELIWPHRAKK